MKKLLCGLLALAMCLAFAACNDIDDEPTVQNSDPTQSRPDPQLYPDHTASAPADAYTPLALKETGAATVPYSVTVSNARYITSADQLPEYDVLDQYDAAYFENNALLVVLETVSSAAVRASIAAVQVYDGRACVILDHAVSSDSVIPTCTTWLLWAEVERGLDYTWTVDNPAMEPSAGTE